MLSINQNKGLSATPFFQLKIRFFAFVFISLSLFAPAFIGMHAPAPSVVAELRLNEGTGTTTADGSGNVHPGTLTNGPTWVAGKYGQAVNLDGTNDYIAIADHADFTLDPAQSYTWSTWVKNNSFKEWSTLWSQTIDNSSFFYFYAHTSSDADGGPVTNGLSVYWWTNGGTNKLALHSNNNVLTAGQWSYVTVTYNGTLAQNSRFTIYVNGVDVTNRSDVASTGTIGTINPTNTRIGSNQPYGEYLSGAVDEVRYYRRLLSLAEIQSDMNIGNTPDTEFPVVSVSSPTAGSTVSSTVNVDATATDNLGVTGVQFLLDNVNLGTEDLTAPYSVSWNTTTISNGNHTLTAKARDAAGNITTSAPVTVNVNNFIDTELPTVSVTSPAAGATVSTTINVNANASDNVGVVGVQFLLDGVNLGTEDLTAPYSVSWNTAGASNASHTLTARARDAAGNSKLSDPVIVTVFNSNLVASYGFSENTGTVVNDNSGNGNNGTLTNGPTWSPNGKYGSAVLFDGTDDIININDANSLDLTNGMTVEAWVNPGNLTGYKTVISKENGTTNLAYALSANNNTSGSANQRPNSRIVTGTTTRTVTGTAKLALNTWTHLASTYDGTTMRFYVNGTQVATFATTGNIAVTTNMLRIGGSPNLGSQYFAGLIDEVRVYNRALAQSEIQTDMNTPVAPDLTNPVVSITGPAAGSTVSGSINLTANATDNIAVTGVQFVLDGADFGTEDITAPYSIQLNTVTLSNATHTVSARARDAANNSATAADVSFTVFNDTQTPTVSVTAPAAGSTVAGTVSVNADAADNVGVAGVQFLLDGVNLGSEVTTAPYTVSWNTTSGNDGNHTLTARARDAAGNSKTSDPVTVAVLNTVPDTELPTVAVTSPAAGATISATINVTANATDNNGVVGVQFLLDGANLGTEDLTAPYSVSLNTLPLSNGDHIISARARDAAGNSKTATDVTITVFNDKELPAVSITDPSTGTTVGGTIGVTASASDNVGIVGVQFLLDGVNLGSEVTNAPYTISWNTTSIGDGSHTLTAKAHDAAGNNKVSDPVSVTVSNPDAEFPTVSITVPATGATVSATINVTANAADNKGVIGVQFLLDGVNLGAEDLTVPYSVSWNTTTASNANHTLTAKARDAAGNVTTSSDVAVTVSNDTQAPTVSITAPATGTVTGAINVNANAADNVGVVGVQFLLDNVNLGSEDLTSPYSISWNSATTPNGVHTLTAKARDAAGNLTTSAGVSVTVSNVANMIVALPLNEGSGTAAADISGSSHPGTLTNGPTWGAGKYGQGVNLDGTNDFIAIADHADFTLDPAQSYTWSAWVKNNNLNEWSTVWSQTIDNNSFFYFYAHTTLEADGGPVTNGISVYWWTNGGNNKLVVHSNNNVLTSGQWNYITVTYNGSVSQTSRFTIYVNGIDVTNRSDVASVGTIASINPTNTRIGSNQPYGEYLNGAVDEVRFYRRLLTAAEITNDMNTPLAADNIAPTVSVSAPAAGTDVSGAINVTANASDNLSVAGVQFLLDGANLGTEDVTAPYSVSWNTAGASTGNHTLAARARDAAGNSTTSAGVAVNVIRLPDYSFTLQTANKSVGTTGSTDFKADIAFLNGFTSNNIALSVSGLPSGVTANYTVNPMTGAGTAQLLVTTTNAAQGSYNLTLTAVAEGITHTQPATLVVTGPADFALSASPASQNITAGNPTSFTITLSETNDFVNPVTLSVTGLPAGVTGSFSPAAPVPAATSTLTLNSTSGAPSGTYSLTVQGVSGSVTRTTVVNLTINTQTGGLTILPGFFVTNVAGGWDQPMGTVFTGDGQKMFVWEKKGQIWVCNRNSQQLYDKQNTPVLNIEPEVGNWGDHGLMSIALDPAFNNSGGYVYLLYVVDRKFLLNDNSIPADQGFEATIGRITRYKIITNGSGELVADLSDRKILLGETKKTGIPILHDSHGLGTLLFASDGTLLSSAGDGASYFENDVGSDSRSYYVKALADSMIRSNENVGAFRAQLLNSHSGKILRMDPATGDGVPSNPFYLSSDPRAPQSRVWALGLRNPFRMTMRPGKGSTNPAAGDIGEIYVGDVGFNTYEELEIITRPGMNLGWPLYEGLNIENGYASFTTLNRDEPNPLSGGSCAQFFQFRQLIKQATADGVTTLFNPCNTSTPIPGTANNLRFFHRRPALEWKHDQDLTRVGIFTGNTANVATIGTPESGVTGSPFRGNCSVGGVWYTGTSFPSQYQNTYFHCDYGAQWIKNFNIAFTDVVQSTAPFASGFGAIIGVNMNPADGSLYCIDLGDNTVKRISYGGNQIPVVKMTSDKTFGPSALSVNFNGSNSFDPDGGALTYSWNFGDNTTSTETNPAHTFTASPNTPTRYVVKLTVRDIANATAIDSIIISVNNTPPVVNITSPVKNSTYKIGVDTIYSLRATVTDLEHGPGQLKYQWQTILRHNNHEHPGPIDTTRNTSTGIARVGCQGDEYYYLIRLKVTDAAGLSTVDSSIIRPDCGSPSLLVLDEFSVAREGYDNVVRWTIDEDDKWTRNFEVQVSSDGYRFFTIDKQNTRNKGFRNSYSFSDKNFPQGVNYYRLKTMERGQSVKYSAIVKIDSETPRDGLTIFPNPSTGNFLVRYNAKEKGAITMRINDITGKLVEISAKNVTKGQNIFYMQNTNGWKPGMYFISIQQGENFERGKLLIQ